MFLESENITRRLSGVSFKMCRSVTICERSLLNALEVVLSVGMVQEWCGVSVECKSGVVCQLSDNVS